MAAGSRATAFRRMGVRAARFWTTGLCAALVAATFLVAAPGAGAAGERLGAALAPAASREPFRLDAGRAPDGVLLLRWTVQPGTYLYRDSLEAVLDGAAVPLARPAGEVKDDPNFGRVDVYHHDMEARVAVPATSGRLTVGFQGCSEKGICFPPQTRDVDLATLQVGKASSTPTLATIAPTLDTDEAGVAAPADGLFRAGLGGTMLAFLGFGLLLAATPCVFPMIPILAGMLTGAGAHLTRRRSLVLAGGYVLAMAAAYGLVGAVAGWTGANLQAALQTPLALGLTAAVFVLLALSMFGLFDLALPAGLAARLAGRAGGGSLGGAVLLGFGSALIVGPCVTPPLAGAMLYAASTGEAITGAAALSMLGLGMGLPLMLVGFFGPSLLPKGGMWLLRARQIFAVVFLGVAVLVGGRLLAPPATLALLGALLLGAGVFFGGFDRLTAASGTAARLARGGGLLAALYGATLVVGAAGGADDPLRPLAFLGRPAAVEPVVSSARVASPAAFDAALARAGADGRPILVDFTAAWCTVCRSNEKVMAAPELRARLAGVPQVTADVTDYGTPTRALMERFGVAGPPTVFLIDAKGRELPGSRLVGPVTAEELLRRLDAAGA